MKRSLWILVALVAAGLLAPPVHAQYFGRNKIQYRDHHWHILSTPHFDIHYYEGAEAFAARAGLVLEDGYGMLAEKMREVLPWRVPVILYASHEDFLQTNIDPSIIGEGVQAFAEPRRRRIVLPFTQSFKEFQHAAVHELAHIFTFQVIYNRMLDNVFTRSYLPGMPLWVAEGIAEYLAVGWDADSDMYIRDAIIHDYLPPFYGVGGFYVYKEGQSVFNYIAETYGHEKVLELLQVIGRQRNTSAALSRTIGLDEKDLQEQWSKALRKHYWPLYPDKVEVDDVARRLTDHIRDHGYYNSRPVLSPDGERIAFFSDRSGFIEILVMSALDGKILQKVVTGSRSNRFESLHFLNSGMAWSPDGKSLAFVARSSGRDALFVKNLETGRERLYAVESDGLSAPAWSPDGSTIVLSGVFAGQTDLVSVRLDTGAVERLTHDAADQLTPRFFPDGRRVVFVYYPEVTRRVPENFEGANRDVLAEIDFLDPANVRHDASYDIWELDLDTGRQRPIVATPGDDTDPVILEGGRAILFASDVSGINNLHYGDIARGEFHRVTDVLGGIFSPSVNEAKGRIAFSAFRKGGHDVFVSDDLRGLLAHRYPDEAAGVLAHSPRTATRDLAAEKEPDETREVARADTTSGPVDPLDTAAFEPVLRVGAAGDTLRSLRAGSGATTRSALDRPVPVDDVDFRGARVSEYHTRIAPDFVGQGGGLFFSTGFGFGISNSIAMSDILGNHRMLFAFNLFRNIEESDFLLTYSYLRRRADVSVGLFQFKSYFDSRFTSLGEGFASDQLFSERNYGLFGRVSVPFNTFYRMDLDLQAYVSDREFFDIAGSDRLFVRTRERSKRRLVEPSIDFVHDSSFFGPFGPVEGSRWRLSLSRALGFSDRDVERVTAVADYRWYHTLFYRNSVAFRLLAAGSSGDDARAFFLGGPTTLRGYDWQDFLGTKLGMVSVEYRFPLIDALILGWPSRWGFTNIGGTLFADAGATWDRHDPDFFRDGHLADLRADVGVGAFMYFGYLLLNFQLAWPTDGQTISNDAQFHFWIGPTF